MAGASTTSETSVNSSQSTRRYNPEDSHLQQEFILSGEFKGLNMQVICSFSGMLVVGSGKYVKSTMKMCPIEICPSEVYME
jgi:hypothetical protein